MVFPEKPKMFSRLLGGESGMETVLFPEL